MATRRELADRAAAAYAAAPAVAAVLLGGSVSRGEHDRFSDIELGVFWHDAPADEDRSAAIARAGGEVLRLWPYAEHEAAWFDEWLVDGVVVEPVHMTVDATEGALTAVLERHDPDSDKQVLLAAVVDGVALHGDELLGRWCAAARAFPDGLVRALIDRHAPISNFWHLEMARERDNPFLAHRKIVEIHERVLRVLLAMNRVYWYGFKLLDEIERRLPVAPRDLANRIRNTYRVSLAEAEPLLHDLVHETYDLIERHVSGVDVARLRRVFAYRHEPRDD